MEFKIYEEKMINAINYLLDLFADVRAGRANPNILNKVTVMYYGVETPINQTAGISVPEAKQILIQPWDKSIIKEIERAINEANIGITPQNDGNVLRLIFPDLTEERRKTLVKEIKEMSENSKITIRNIRRDMMDEIKELEKQKMIAEDDKKRYEEDAQKLVDKYIKKIEDEYNQKEKEIMTI